MERKYLKVHHICNKQMIDYAKTKTNTKDDKSPTFQGIQANWTSGGK